MVASPTKGAAELVVHGMRNAAGENVFGLQPVIAMVLKQAPVVIVAARFQRDAGHGATGTSQFRVVVRGADVDHGNGFGWGDDAGQVLDIVVDTFQHVIVALVEPIHYR